MAAAGALQFSSMMAILLLTVSFACAQQVTDPPTVSSSGYPVSVTAYCNITAQQAIIDVASAGNVPTASLSISSTTLCDRGEREITVLARTATEQSSLLRLAALPQGIVQITAPPPVAPGGSESEEDSESSLIIGFVVGGMVLLFVVFIVVAVAKSSQREKDDIPEKAQPLVAAPPDTAASHNTFVNAKDKELLGVKASADVEAPEVVAMIERRPSSATSPKLTAKSLASHDSFYNQPEAPVISRETLGNKMRNAEEDDFL